MPLDLTPHGALRIESVVNGPIQTNTYFVLSGEECVVIDPAWDGEKLAAHVERAHPGARITAIVATHGHADHVGGVAGLKDVLGPEVPFALPARDIECMRTNVQWQKVNFGFDTPEPPEPDRLLAEGDVISVGDCVLQVIETPGHTPGGVVLFAAAAEGNFAFVGDTLFPGGHGRTDLAGGSDREILDSLEKMKRELPADTTCLCGHGPSTTMAREAAVNPYIA